MATVGTDRVGRGSVERLLDRFGLDWIEFAVGSVALVALVARLFELGARVAHWDEGRVAYWTIRYIETGNVEYRPIIHGPFYHHVNKYVFEAMGATDVTMRLVVAVAGGLFPLVALLFRDHLRDVEVAALAGFFALNPILLYYSRFMRGDPLVAMFMFTAFALFLRAVDTRRVAYLYGGVAFTALGMTVKENALLYLVTWVGAAALVADHRMLTAAERPDPWRVAWSWLGQGWRLLKRRYGTLVLLTVEFLAIIVFFYAPRRATESGPGLWKVLDDPGMAGDVLYVSTVGVWQDLWDLWVSGSHQDHSYIPYFGHFLQTMGHGALALSLLALIGFLVDRYTGDGPSTLPSFCFYWGFASVLGYPLVTDIMAPWATVNAVVPLAVPAAVGVGLFVGWGRDAWVDADVVRAVATSFALLAVLGLVVGTSFGAVYANPQSDENYLVQYAQPAGEFGPVMDQLAAIAPQNQGPDVVFYGEYFVDGGDASVPRQPGCIKWFNALPLPWYLAASDAEVECHQDADSLATTVSESQPPYVVVRRSATETVAGAMQNYESRTYLLRSHDTSTTVYVHEDYADEIPPTDE